MPLPRVGEGGGIPDPVMDPVKREFVSKGKILTEQSPQLKVYMVGGGKPAAWEAAQTAVTAIWSKASPDHVASISLGLLKRDWAEQKAIQVQQLKDLFGSISDNAIQQAPQVIAYAGADKQNPELTSALADATDFFTSFYGSDAASPFLSTFLLNDEISRQKTFTIVKEVTGWVPPSFMAEGGNIEDDEAANLLSFLVSSPDPKGYYDTLSAAQQRGVYSMSQDLLETAAPLQGRLRNANTILHTGDISTVWNADDVAKLQQMMVELESTQPGGTNNLSDMKESVANRTLRRGAQNTDEATLNRMFGVTQVRAIDSGQLVIDEKWAQEHPDKAVAFQIYLQQLYPDVEIVVGQHGIVGGILDGLGRVAETIGAPVGALWRQSGELIERLDFGPFANNTEEMQRRLDAAKQAVADGTVPPGELPDALHFIQNTEEDLSSDIGWKPFQEDMAFAVSVGTPSVGFGTNFAKGVGLMPGDAGYEPTVLVAGLVSQVVFDPTNWIFNAVTGWRSGMRIIKPEGVQLRADQYLAQMTADLTKQGLPIPAGLEKVAKRMASLPTERFGTSYLRSKILSNVVRTPADMAVTQPFIDANKVMYGVLDDLGPEAFQDIMARYVGLKKARLYSQATGEADLGEMMVRTMQGRNADMAVVDTLKVRRNATNKQLRGVRDLKRAGARPARPV